MTATLCTTPASNCSHSTLYQKAGRSGGKRKAAQGSQEGAQGDEQDEVEALA